MSRDNAPLIVSDDDGTVGVLETDDRPVMGSSDSVPMRLEDGRSIRVPLRFLADGPDGSLRLRVSRAELDGLASGARVEEAVIPLVAEEVEIGKRKVERGKVRVNKGVETREEAVSVPLIREQVDVERVPVNRPVDGPVEVRREGDVWIVPVLEEVLVVEKRLMLKEELRITRRRVEETATERVTLRTETATVERDGRGGSSSDT
jgi:uncharacterized protein (TIGR02271 family)